MSAETDRRYMRRALELAGRGRYTTAPNPAVGCVVVGDGQIVGEAWHMRAGEPHAEVHALHRAAGRTRGATAYVTLEPCSHQGRTPPCTEALIEAGVARVVAAMADPNPAVAGRGLARLREAGIETETGLLEDEAREINRGFIRRMETGRPWLTLKLAMSLDGRTAMASGESRWITGEASRTDVHHLRAASGAVLTGIETVLADDPSLNVRLPGGPEGPDGERRDWPQPMRVIVDSRLRCPPQARTLSLPGGVLIATVDADPARRAALEEGGAGIFESPGVTGRVDLAGVLDELGRREVNEVLAECGPTLAGALLAGRLADELVVYVAPHVMGDEARGLVHLPGLERMDQRLGLRFLHAEFLGADLRVRAVPDSGNGGG